MLPARPLGRCLQIRTHFQLRLSGGTKSNESAIQYHVSIRNWSRVRLNRSDGYVQSSRYSPRHFGAATANAAFGGANKGEILPGFPAYRFSATPSRSKHSCGRYTRSAGSRWSRVNLLDAASQFVLVHSCTNEEGLRQLGDDRQIVVTNHADGSIWLTSSPS
jgi:hypothetical protein